MLTKEDKEYRREKIGASDSSAIMGINPWVSPLMLWEQKLGLRPETEVNSAIQRGNDLEDAAREQFTQLTGIHVKPRRIEHSTIPYMFATLDGISECGSCIVEIKVPGQKTYDMALAGEIPEAYLCQIQHQVEVVKPKEAFYFCFNGTNGIVIEVKPNKAYIDELLKKEAEFYRCMIDLSPPEATLKDYVKREDEEWLEYAEKYKSAKSLESRYKKEAEDCREKLIQLSGGSSSMGGGISLSKGLRKGIIPYATIPEVKALDLEKHRQLPTQYWRVS